MNGSLLALAAIALAALASSRSSSSSSSSSSRIRDDDPPPRDDMIPLITREANAQGVPLDLALATAYVESRLQPSAIGDDGISVGLYQINRRAHPEHSTQQLLDPAYNARVGIGMLAAYLKRFGASDDYLAVRLRYTGATSDAARQRVRQKWGPALAWARRTLGG